MNQLLRQKSIQNTVIAAPVTAIVDEYSQWLSVSDVPKLSINGEPGRDTVGSATRVLRNLDQPAGSNSSRITLPPGRLAPRYWSDQRQWHASLPLG